MSTSSNVVSLSSELQTKFDLGIWFTLFNWASLTVAVQNQWGGPDSSDKRDWLAGQISELFANAPTTDNEDVEIMLLQILEDEFGVRLEDETEINVARDIMLIKKEISDGDVSTVDKLQKKWEARKGKEVEVGNIHVNESNQDVEWDSVNEESEEDDEDVDMCDTPVLIPAKPKPQPEVDDEGFTKVVGKKKR